MEKLSLWARQPTTVAGIAVLVGGGLAVMLEAISRTEAIPLLASALVSIVLPDNSGDGSRAAKTKKELTVSIESKIGVNL